MNVVLIGPPGVGKGTQASRLARRFHMVHIATGDLLRAAVRSRSPIGVEIEPVMKAGRLVPDTLVTRVVNEALAGHVEAGRNAFLFDGYPRDQAQAEMFDEMLDSMSLLLDLAVRLMAPEEVLLRRLSGRRVCGNCGATYHVEFKPPKQDGRCDECGEQALRRRSDDHEDSIRERLRIYGEEVQPLLTRYGQRGVLVDIAAESSPDETFDRIVAAIEAAAEEPARPRF